MNSFSKRPSNKHFTHPNVCNVRWFCLLFFALVLAFPKSGFALALQGLYTAACQREIGTILEINNQSVQLLTVSGKLVEVPKYEIIFMAEYPLDRLPNVEKVDLGPIPKFTFATRKGNDLVPLATGWPVEFSEEKVSILSEDGTESLIDKRSIWKVSQQASGLSRFRSGLNGNAIEFVHPYAFRDCATAAHSVRVYPQQILNDPVLIKKELDRLQKGFALLDRYNREQDFYPVPEVYKTSTSLGMWMNFGSRYGSSKKRSNNFTPLLKDEYSSDIFDFQRIVLTGSGPLMYGSHEEPQTQATYAFKASYFHFSLMADPSVLLVGSNNYKWQANDFAFVDDRFHEAVNVLFGFDFGRISIILPLGTSISYGIFDGALTTTGSLGLVKTGVQYRGTASRILVIGGGGSNGPDDDDGGRQGSASMQFGRLEFETQFSPKWSGTLFAIQRTLSFAGKTSSTRRDVDSNFSYRSDSLTGGLYLDYLLSHRFTIRSLISAESKTNKLNVANPTSTFVTGSNYHFYPKFGTSLHLSF